LKCRWIRAVPECFLKEDIQQMINVSNGEDNDLITKLVGWEGGGGFVYGKIY
jgi:hypothetical protein